jgi:hypothetical protein
MNSRVLQRLFAALLGVALMSLPNAAVAGPPAQTDAGSPPTNPIVAENAQSGDPKWHRATAPMNTIEGYTSTVSVAPGDQLQLHVSTAPAERYRVVIYRLGWYGGAGARLLSCLPSCNRDEQGKPEPTPPPDPSTGLVRDSWPVTDSLTVPPSWVSGYYVAALYLTSGGRAGQQRLVPFIVRPAPNVTTPILVQASVNTWQAYNCWGGRSLYPICGQPPAPAGVTASFDRPYYPANLLEKSEPLRWEYPLVRFLEREGYNVSYTTDVDTDLSPGSLLTHRVVIVNGHDEYWSKTMRDAFEAARDHGVNLMFMGGDIGDWQIRYQDADRTIVEYRNAKRDPEPNPALKTVKFADLRPPRNPCELLGTTYQRGTGKPRPYVVTPSSAATFWTVGTRLTSGSLIQGGVGSEWNAVLPGCKRITDLLHWTSTIAGISDADAVTYVAPSGARVFTSGSLDFNQVLDTWPTSLPASTDAQQLITNLLDSMIASRPRCTLTTGRGKAHPAVRLLCPAPARVTLLLSIRRAVHRGASRSTGTVVARRYLQVPPEVPTFVSFRLVSWARLRHRANGRPIVVILNARFPGLKFSTVRSRLRTRHL